MARPDLPPAVWLIPWAGLLILPAAGSGPIGSRLGVLFAELLLGLPALLATPPILRPEILPFPRLPRNWLLGAVLLAPLAAVLHALVALLVNHLFPMPSDLEETLRQALVPGSPAEALLIGASLLIVAPIMEEIFFRGLLPWLWKRHFPRGAVAVPALLFAVSHANPWAFPSLLLLGLLLGLLRERSGSLLPGILIHGAVNLLGYGLLQWPTPPGS
ncbi:MAG: type II CAAX endopeptidase family protein [bacterium]|jgi:membrane protease YdiL (CAAX protease family)|nr:type II CAAX endopeptidase family protein [bacterium]